VLLTAVIATYAGRAVAALLAGQTQWIFGL
jgi:hypothetical protein